MDELQNKVGKYKFVRLRYGYISEDKSDGTTFWRKEINGQWINSVGGRTSVHTTTDSDSWIVIETVYADNFSDLDWSKTYLNNPKLDSGWLAPDGTFYGCPYEDHDSCSYYVLKKTIEQLDEEGYVRIHYKDRWSCNKEITEAQAKFLIDNNYVDEYNRLQDFYSKSWAKAYKYFNNSNNGD